VPDERQVEVMVVALVALLGEPKSTEYSLMEHVEENQRKWTLEQQRRDPRNGCDDAESVEIRHPKEIQDQRVSGFWWRIEVG